MNVALYISGILLQLAAAVIALLQVRYSIRKLPWFLIALSSLIIVARRSMALEEVMSKGGSLAAGELLTLPTALLFFFGVLFMGRFFREIKVMHEALQESEQTYRTVADFTYDWELWLDPQGRLLYCSPSCERMTGYGADAFTADPGLLATIAHPDDWDAFARHLQEEQYPQTEVYHDDFRIITRSGEMRWLSHYCVAVMSREGAFLGRRVSNRDITSRRQAEELHLQSEATAWALLNAPPDACQLLDAAGRILNLNDRMARRLQRSREALLNKIVWDLLPEDVARRRKAMTDQVFATGRAVRFKDQREDLWLENAIYPIKDDDGTVHSVAVFSRDITESRLLEDERVAEIEVLNICTQAQSTRQLMQTMADFLRHCTGCEAVGVRLRAGDDFPYYETRGFPADFVQAESSLCLIDLHGQVTRDSIGNPVLECMCGNILCGRFDPSKPFFTPKGSFWTNSTTKLLASTTEADRQARTRNRCNGEGYESVALVPLRWQAETLGLLQFNDKRPGRFTARRIAHWEALATSMAVTLAKLQADAALEHHLHDLSISNVLLDAINEMLRESLRGATTATQLAEKCLAIAERVTGSEYGFVNELNAAGRYDCIALTDPGWQACRIPASQAVLLPRNLPVRGFGGKVVQEGQSLIVNDPAAHPDCIALPEGHPPIRCFLGTPLLFENGVLGLIALANKKGGYDQHDQQAIEQLARAFVAAYQRKRAEEWLRLNEARLETLVKLSTLNVAPNEACDFVLEEAVLLTRSAIGFLGFVSEDERTMIIHAWSRTAMQECAVDNKPIQYPIEKAGSWGEALRQKRPVIVNNYEASHAGKRGLPAGHVALARFVAVPLIRNGQAVAVIAAANKDDDYDDADVRQLHLLLDGLWRHVRRKQEDERTLQSLREKEVLLREIHHRVKNNLAVVSGLLDMQADFLSSKEVLTAFQESKNRIASMGLVHSMLYQSDDFARVDMQQYIEKLMALLRTTLVPYGELVSVEVDSAESILDIDRAIPCGIIINELFTNAVRHAFPEGRQGAIRISCAVGKDVCDLIFSDNGIGLPADMDAARCNTMGLQLVHLLVRQLDGTVAVDRAQGTRFEIRFPM